MALAIPFLAGCQSPAVHSSGRATLLTAAEMDRVTASSAGAANQLEARALPPNAQALAIGATLAVSADGPVAGPPFLALLSPNYSGSRGSALATSGQSAETAGSNTSTISLPDSGVRIDAAVASTATGAPTSRAQTSLQFDGISIDRVDLVFGTAISSACCAPVLGAQASADGGGGPYAQELQGFPVSTIPGQVQGRVDIAAAASAVPLVNAGQIMALAAPHGVPAP